MKHYVGLLMALKKNENKGVVELTLSQKQTNNSLKTDKYMTVIPTQCAILLLATGHFSTIFALRPDNSNFGWPFCQNKFEKSHSLKY